MALPCASTRRPLFRVWAERKKVGKRRTAWGRPPWRQSVRVISTRSMHKGVCGWGARVGRGNAGRNASAAAADGRPSCSLRVQQTRDGAHHTSWVGQVDAFFTTPLPKVGGVHTHHTQTHHTHMTQQWPWCVDCTRCTAACIAVGSKSGVGGGGSSLAVCREREVRTSEGGKQDDTTAVHSCCSSRSRQTKSPTTPPDDIHKNTHE